MLCTSKRCVPDGISGNLKSNSALRVRQGNHMADLEAYKDKFGESGQRVLQNALGESKRRDQNYIAVEHIIHGLAREEPDLFDSTMRGLALDPVLVTQAFDKRLDGARQHVGKGFRI